MSGEYSTAWTEGIPLRSRLIVKVWGRVKKTYPDMTMPDAIDYALKQFLKSEKNK
jgi:hypothetical protein